MSETRIELTGHVVLSAGGHAVEVSPVGRRILAFVCLHERQVPRGALAAAIWPDVSDTRARTNLRAAVWRFQRTAPCVLEADDASVALDPRVAVDLIDLRRRAADSIRTQRVDDELGAHPGLLCELAPEIDDEWIDVERERWRQLRLHILVLHLAALRASGRDVEADALARRARAGAPRHEALLAQADMHASRTARAPVEPGTTRARCQRSGPPTRTTSHSKEPSR